LLVVSSLNTRLSLFGKLKFPLLANLRKNGIVFLDHILLEDLAKFCKMKEKSFDGIIIMVIEI
jgi:hypothetical protein